MRDNQGLVWPVLRNTRRNLWYIMLTRSPWSCLKIVPSLRTHAARPAVDFVSSSDLRFSLSVLTKGARCAWLRFSDSLQAHLLLAAVATFPACVKGLDDYVKWLAYFEEKQKQQWRKDVITCRAFARYVSSLWICRLQSDIRCCFMSAAVLIFQNRFNGKSQWWFLRQNDLSFNWKFLGGRINSGIGKTGNGWGFAMNFRRYVFWCLYQVDLSHWVAIPLYS